MKKIINKHWPVILIVLIWFIFSSPFFLKGLVPYASYYQSNFFSPWSAYSIYEGPVKNNAMPDVITQIYPWRDFSISALLKGSIPLWNPYNFSGTPHLANYQSAALFPLNVVFLVPFDFINSWSILVLLQPLLAGAGMYLFLRSFKLSGISALIGSLAFMFCGFLVTWMGYATLGYAILFLPYALFAINKYFESKSYKYLLILALTIPLSFLAGHFQTSIYFICTTVAYLIFSSFANKNLKSFLVPLFFIIAGFLLSAPQILPSVEFYTQSVRQEIITQLEVIPPIYLTTLFAPDFFGNPVTRNDWFGHYAEWNGYSGVIPLFLALFSVFALWKKSKKVIFFSILALVSLLLAFDTPINDLVFALKLPVLSTSASGRIIVLFSFSVAVLSGFGFDALISFLKKTSFTKLIIVLTPCVLIISLIWLIPFFGVLPDIEKNGIARSNLVLPTLFLFSFIFLGAAFFVLKKYKKSIYVFSILTLLIVSFDLLRFSTKWQTFEPKEYVFKDVPINDFYKKNKTEERFFGKLSAENSVYYKLQALGGYDPLYPGRYGEFVKYVDFGKIERGDRSVVDFPNSTPRTGRAIDFLGVGYIAQKKSDDGQVWAFPFGDYRPDKFEIVYEDDIYKVYKNRDVFPRAFVVNSYEVITDDNKILEKMFSQNFDLRKNVVLENDPGIDKLEGAATSKIVKYLPEEIEIAVDSENEAILVLTDTFYPGWSAYVNNEKQEIIRADYTFRGVAVPSGKSNVRFIYEPQSFKTGIYLLIVGIGIITGGYFLIKKNERKD